MGIIQKEGPNEWLNIIISVVPKVTVVLAQYVEDMAGPGSGVDRYRDSGPDKLEIHNKLLLER